MKLVHKSLTASVLAGWVLLLGNVAHTGAQNATAPAYQAFYNAAAGFKPAQPNLTQVFLQIAGSLESSGSPEGYIRHMQQEHFRISQKFAATTGKEHMGRMPAHMTPDYLDRLVSNWKALSPKLGLDALAMEAGRCAREAIRGPSNNGTAAIKIFNEHQAVVVHSMETGTSEGASFERLQSRLQAEWGLLPAPEAAKLISAQQEQYFSILAKKEKALSETEREDYLSLLRHPRFTKADFAEVDRFYKKPFDKLSEAGKDEMSQRVWAGTHQAELKAIQMDAINPAKEFLHVKETLYRKIDAALPPEKSSKIKQAIDGVFLDLGELAQSELAIAILDLSLSK